MATPRARRSPLILPVNVPRFVEKAYARGADAIVLGLELSRGLTPGHVCLSLAIETPRGFLAAEEIAAGSPAPVSSAAKGRDAPTR